MSASPMGKIEYGESYPSSTASRFVLQVLSEESQQKLHPELTLQQLFQNNRVRFAVAIHRIEVGLGERLCDDLCIQWLRTRSVEFIVWALDRAGGDNQQATEEFEMLHAGEPIERVPQVADVPARRRQKELFQALRVAESAEDPDGIHPVEKFKALESMRKCKKMMMVWFKSLRLFRRQG